MAQDMLPTLIAMRGALETARRTIIKGTQLQRANALRAIEAAIAESLILTSPAPPMGVRRTKPVAYDLCDLRLDGAASTMGGISWTMTRQPTELLAP